MARDDLPPAILEAEMCPLCRMLDCEHTEEEQDAARQAQARGEEGPSLSHDRQQHARKITSAKKLEQRRQDDMRTALATRETRRVLWRFLTMAHVDELSYRPDDDKRHLIFREGERNIGQAIKAAIVAADPQMWVRMQSENLGEHDGVHAETS